MVERVDGPRFRGGIAATAGAEFVPDADFTGLMMGADGRLGVQINDLVGIYAAAHLSFGTAEWAGANGTTGTFAALLMADFTFIDTIFVGAGVGYAVFNNPSGVAIGLRAGAYPARRVSSMRARRIGLMIGLESRIVLLGDPYSTGFMVMGAIGYEAF